MLLCIAIIPIFFFKMCRQIIFTIFFYIHAKVYIIKISVPDLPGGPNKGYNSLQPKPTH